jgi:hypothetical protein
MSNQSWRQKLFSLAEDNSKKFKTRIGFKTFLLQVASKLSNDPDEILTYVNILVEEYKLA